MTTAHRDTRAVLLVGHGTIVDTDDVPEFLRRVRHGRPANAELIEEIRRRYAAIGRSPLLDTTESLARKLEERLGMPTRVAMRYWAPLVPDVLLELGQMGVQYLYILPVAPFSVHVYARVVTEALAEVASAFAAPPLLVPVAPYGGAAAWVRAHADRIAESTASLDPSDTSLILTAHSLPTSAVAAGDPYQRQFEASARAIALSLRWPASVAYQSQGAGGGEWLGPTLGSALEEARALGKRRVVVAPVGFLADHVETLYDLDVEARGVATALGLEFARVPALGDAPALVDALSGVVRQAIG